MTRVLAGPVASRFLAGYGADVLRIDPPSWDEPGVVPEVTLGNVAQGWIFAKQMNALSSKACWRRRIS
jgi:crotonobetainyl-CoA:carnitine CoA-transferase CaiB-like acyl-CoA transferase